MTSGVTTSHLIWVRKLELPAVACPADEGLARLVGQQLQEKLPQLDGAAACRTDGREGVHLKTMVFTLRRHIVGGVDTGWWVDFIRLVSGWGKDVKILLYF